MFVTYNIMLVSSPFDRALSCFWIFHNIFSNGSRKKWKNKRGLIFLAAILLMFKFRIVVLLLLRYETW